MADLNETRALKASVRGALASAAELLGIQDRIEALDDHAEIDIALLEDLARITAAHAVASAALRGLVNTMLARRGAGASA